MYREIYVERNRNRQTLIKIWTATNREGYSDRDRNRYTVTTVECLGGERKTARGILRLRHSE